MCCTFAFDSASPLGLEEILVVIGDYWNRLLLHELPVSAIVFLQIPTWTDHCLPIHSIRPIRESDHLAGNQYSMSTPNVDPQAGAQSRSDCSDCLPVVDPMHGSSSEAAELARTT